MKENDDISYITGRWIEKAESDFIAAQQILKMRRKPPFDIVCFHSQQCAEKYMKALLVKLSVPFPKTHDLVVLNQLIPNNYLSGIEVKDLRMLSQHAIEARYPDSLESLGREEAKQALKIAERIRQKIREILLDEKFELS